MPDQQLKLVTIVRKDGNYYAMIAYDEPEKHLMQTGLNDGVDVNVGHFNSCGYRLNILPKRLDYFYLPNFKAGDTRSVYLDQGDYLVQLDHDGHWDVISRDDFVVDYQEIK